MQRLNETFYLIDETKAIVTQWQYVISSDFSALRLHTFFLADFRIQSNEYNQTREQHQQI